MNTGEFSSGKIVKPPSLPTNLGGAGAQGKEVKKGVNIRDLSSIQLDFMAAY